MTQNINHSPTVSVVIPFYNNISWLNEAIESVLAQEYNDYEIIVVNDGSKEDVSEFLYKYGSLIKYCYKENGGAASARNKGIQLACGKYVAFLDSDDLWKENKLSIQITEMEKSNAVWSYTDYEVFGEAIKTKRKIMSKYYSGFYKVVSPYIGTPTVVVKRSCLIENGLLFCEDMTYGEDSIMWAQLLDKYSILYVAENLVAVRIRGANAGRRAASQMIARVKNYDRCVELINCYKKKKSFLYKFAILLCRFGCLFVNEKNEKSGFVEFVAKVLYFVPYLIFKIDRIVFGG